MSEKTITTQTELDQFILDACSGFMSEHELRSKISVLLYEQYVLGFEAASRKVKETLDELNAKR